MNGRILNDKEYRAINQIASRSKMDCWFLISQNEKGDFVYDIENNEKLSLKDGLMQLADGIIEPYEFYGLDEELIVAVRGLFDEMGIVPSFVGVRDEQL